MASLRSRPIGISSLPVTAAGVSSRMLASRVFGTTRTHSFAPARIFSICASGTLRRSFMVSAWLWQRIAPTRTQIDSTAMGLSCRPSILLVSAPPFHSSLLTPSPMSSAIHGIRLPASGTSKCLVGNRSSRRMPATSRSISSIDDAGSSSRSFAARCASPICWRSSRMFCAPAPDAD